MAGLLSRFFGLGSRAPAPAVAQTASVVDPPNLPPKIAEAVEAIETSLDFVVIDVETANADQASICQIGVVGFAGGREVFADAIYIDPQADFSPINVKIHGISGATVEGALTFHDAEPWICERVSNRMVVCHSSFDRAALSKACAKANKSQLACTWIDSVVVAKQAWPEAPKGGYGLASLAAECGLNFRHHDALEDARATGLVLIQALKRCGGDLHHFALADTPVVERALTMKPRQWISEEPRSHAADGPLRGTVIVITGNLNAPRAAVAKRLCDAGADVDVAVTKRTTMLVVGDRDVAEWGSEKSGKQIKAEEYIRRGQAIRIVCEQQLDDLCNAGPA